MIKAWQDFTKTIDNGVGIRLVAREEPLARDGVELLAMLRVRDRDSNRIVNAIVSDFPPAEPSLAVVRALMARLLVHELDETLTVNGERAADPHTKAA